MKLAFRALVALAATAAPLAGQWIEPPGRGWADLTIYHQDTREAFEFDGVARGFFADGHAVSTAAFLTVALGIAPEVDVWVQAPFQRLRYDDARTERLREGVGDTRAYLRVRPLGFLGLDAPFAIRGGVKVPVGDFAVDSEVIPLGDGQTDWELMAEVGHSFHPAPAYVNGWLGYRWRVENLDSRRDFGDEAFFLAQVGGNRGRVAVQMIVEGMWSVTTPVVEGVALPNAERELLQVTPRVGYELGPGSLSLGLRFAVSGRNLPAGRSLVFGYFTRFGL